MTEERTEVCSHCNGSGEAECEGRWNECGICCEERGVCTECKGTGQIDIGEE